MRILQTDCLTSQSVGAVQTRQTSHGTVNQLFTLLKPCQYWRECLAVCCCCYEPSSPCVIGVRAVSLFTAKDQAHSWWAFPQGWTEELAVDSQLLHVEGR